MKISKVFWFSAGIFFLGLAFIGVVVPGIPWSTPTVIAAYCFTKSSNRMHRWLYSHPLFGPFLTGWQNKRIFPTKFKYFMIATMTVSLALLWFTTRSGPAAVGTGLFMLVVAVWAWRYPGSEAEYQRRVDAGKKIAWLK